MKRLVFSILVIQFFVSFTVFAQETAVSPVAVVISSAGKVSVLNGGKSIPAEIGTKLFESDTVITEADGRIQLLFKDDSVISVAPDSEVNLADFEFEEASGANFAANIVKGVARVVSGQIVKRNPEGFKIQTPHATISIRGTTVTAIVTPESSSAIINNATAGLPVQMTSTISNASEHTDISGKMMTADINGTVSIRDATSEEMRMSQALTQAMRYNTEESDGPTRSRNKMAEVPGVDLNITSREATTAIFSGTISNTSGLNANGSFSFDINLQTSNCSNGALDLNTGTSSFSARGGTGAMDQNLQVNIKFDSSSITTTGTEYSSALSATLNGSVSQDMTTFSNGGFNVNNNTNTSIDYGYWLTGTGVIK